MMIKHEEHVLYTTRKRRKAKTSEQVLASIRGFPWLWHPNGKVFGKIQEREGEWDWHGVYIDTPVCKQFTSSTQMICTFDVYVYVHVMFSD